MSMGTNGLIPPEMGIFIGLERAGRFTVFPGPISTESVSIEVKEDLQIKVNRLLKILPASDGMEIVLIYPLGVLYVLNINCGPIQRRRCGPACVRISTWDSQRSS